MNPIKRFKMSFFSIPNYLLIICSGFLTLFNFNSYAQSSQDLYKAEEAYNNNNYLKAISFYGKYMENFPMDKAAYQNRGVCFSKMNDVEKACIDWKFATILGEENTINTYRYHCDSTLSDEDLEEKGMIFPPTYYSDNNMVVPEISPPEFPGGTVALRAYLDSGLLADKDLSIFLTNTFLFAALNISSDGTIQKFVLSESKDRFSINSSSLITSMPNWLPAIQNGKPVSCTYLLPIVNANHFIKLGNRLYNSGVDELQNKNYKAALQLFSKSLDILPMDAEATFNRGACFFQLGDNIGACQDWSVSYFSHYAKANMVLKKYCDGLAIFEEDTIVVDEDQLKEESVYTVVEIMPQFPGGEVKLFEYLAKNIRYPPGARENGVAGVVYVTFLVDPMGILREPKILRGIGKECDEEALRVVKMMPRWAPGRQNKKRVYVKYNLPMNFILK